MSEPVIARAANPIRAANWGLMLLGVAFLGIGLWSATGAFVDLDLINVYHPNSLASSGRWSRDEHRLLSSLMAASGHGACCGVSARPSVSGRLGPSRAHQDGPSDTRSKWSVNESEYVGTLISRRFVAP